MLRLDDIDLCGAPTENLVRLAAWLNVLPTLQTNESAGSYRQRIIRNIQREEKRLSKQPTINHTELTSHDNPT